MNPIPSFNSNLDPLYQIATKEFQKINDVAFDYTWDTQKDIKFILIQCGQLYDQAQKNLTHGNLELTYIQLTRFSIAFLEVIPKLGPLSDSDKKKYMSLKNNQLKLALQELENLKKKWIDMKVQELRDIELKKKKIPAPSLPTSQVPSNPLSSLGSSSFVKPIVNSSASPTSHLSEIKTFNVRSIAQERENLVSHSLTSFPTPSSSFIVRPSSTLSASEGVLPSSTLPFIRRPLADLLQTPPAGKVMLNTNSDYLRQSLHTSPQPMIPFSRSSRRDTILRPLHSYSLHSPYIPPSSSPSTSRPFKYPDSIATTAPLSVFAPRVYMESRFHDSESSLSTVTRGAVGLKNLGNTCFMNSILQCLFGTVPLVRFFASGKFREYINQTNSMGTQGRVATAFFRLIQDLQRNSSTFVAPVEFKDVLEAYAPHMMDGSQQDSQEFLSFVLEALHEDLKYPSSEKLTSLPTNNDDLSTLPPSVASSKAWDRTLQRNPSFLVDLFQGQLGSTLLCTRCQYTSTTYTPFMHLSLPLPSNSTCTLNECIELFLKPTHLEGDNAWKCPQCNQKVAASQTLFFTHLPYILVLHFKRFSYSTVFRNKLDALIQFPLSEFEITPPFSTSSSRRYQLYAVSNHYGGLDGGHYTAVVKHGDGLWYYFDDCRVSSCSTDKVVTSAAYNLFYLATDHPQI